MSPRAGATAVTMLSPDVTSGVQPLQPRAHPNAPAAAAGAISAIRGGETTASTCKRSRCQHCKQPHVRRMSAVVRRPLSSNVPKLSSRPQLGRAAVTLVTSRRCRQRCHQRHHGGRCHVCHVGHCHGCHTGALSGLSERPAGCVATRVFSVHHGRGEQGTIGGRKARAGVEIAHLQRKMAHRRRRVDVGAAHALHVLCHGRMVRMVFDRS